MGKNKKRGGSNHSSMQQQQRVISKKAHKKQQKRQLDEKRHEFKPKRSQYAASQRTLLLGEGDLSFGAALALGFNGDAANLTATCFDDEAVATQKYSALEENAETITSLGGSALFGVDATRAHTNKHIARHAPFERVVFNFPHLGSGMKDQARNIQQHQELLRGTFRAAAALLAATGDAELHITLKRGEPYDSWNIVTIAKMCGYKVRCCTPFRPAAWTGYAHRRSIGDEHAGSLEAHEPNAEIEGAKTYCFVLERAEAAAAAHPAQGKPGFNGPKGTTKSKAIYKKTSHGMRKM